MAVSVLDNRTILFQLNNHRLKPESAYSLEQPCLGCPIPTSETPRPLHRTNAWTIKGSWISSIAMAGPYWVRYFEYYPWRKEVIFIKWRQNQILEVIIDTKLHGSIKHWLYSKDFLMRLNQHPLYHSLNMKPIERPGRSWTMPVALSGTVPSLLVFLSHIDPFKISCSRTNQNIWLIFLVIRNTTLWSTISLFWPFRVCFIKVYVIWGDTKRPLSTLIKKYPYYHLTSKILIFFFLATIHGMWDPNSLTRHQTHLPYIGGGVSTTGLLGKSPNIKFYRCTQLMLNSFNFKLFFTLIIWHQW